MLAMVLAIVLGQSGPSFPDLEGHCQFGEIIQSGPRIDIVNGFWGGCGVGYIQPSGRIQISWSFPDGNFGYGVYTREKNTLTGKYGHIGKIKIRPDGSIEGPTFGETLHLRRKNEQAQDNP